MKILVTGSTGFLGKALVRQLLQDNHQVFKYDIIDGYDICNQSQFEKVILDFSPTTVIHLAAVANLNLYQDDISIGEKINIGGTKNILDLCNKYNVRLLFASTCCAYGNTTEYPSKETSPLYTQEPYALSKIESEKEILKFGLPHCCMRLATFYGPDMRQALAVGHFMDKLHHDKEITVHGKGHQTRTLTHVDDIVSGIIAIAMSEPKYDVVNISTTESISVLDMISLLEKCLDKKAVLVFGQDREHQTFREEINNDRLTSLGWTCKHSLETGIQDTYRWYIENGAKFNC